MQIKSPAFSGALPELRHAPALPVHRSVLLGGCVQRQPAEEAAQQPGVPWEAQGLLRHLLDIAWNNAHRRVHPESSRLRDHALLLDEHTKRHFMVICISGDRTHSGGITQDFTCIDSKVYLWATTVLKRSVALCGVATSFRNFCAVPYFAEVKVTLMG
ncbi:hypothetical protein CEXT_192401 [Caerostris extrusa]|uniref:Uncharacterized protein n=1 Tax=Caerostris extrusa TaxID=172846 RepID=A0AAV4VMF1_CAEEX|nr:hypothetical protein CEXT_192401 [Caerostris extrusa]